MATDIMNQVKTEPAGQDELWSAVVKDSSGIAVDITDWTIAMYFANVDDPSDKFAVTSGFDLTDAASGIWTVTIARAVTILKKGKSYRFAVWRKDDGSEAFLAGGIRNFTIVPDA